MTTPNAAITQPDFECCSFDGKCSYSTTPEANGRVAALEEVKAHAPPRVVTAIRSAGFRLLLEGGRPIGTSEWARGANVNEKALNDVLVSHPGRVQLNEAGELVGIAGLTVERTRHELDIDGRTRWTWCALDAIGILGALAATGGVRSSEPLTGQLVTVDFIGGRPISDAALFILGGFDGGNVRTEWCPHVNFFATPGDAAAWVEHQQLKGDIVSVQQIAEEAAQMWRRVAGAERV